MKTNKFISPFIGCVVQNFPFIEESIDGLTQYDLLCKIVDKLNAVITQTNTQTENIEKLEEAFTTLKSYVDNYFNNLDIQTEINNKLDEMATSGELEAIIASYLNTQAVRGFSTLNDLKNATGLIPGAICQTSGKNTYKDGFGSLYRIRNITNEDVVDNDKLVAITSDVSLVAEKITNNISNAKTTGTTNTYSCDYINNNIDNLNNTIGTIVESGSNANGNWIKYSDGTMICTKKHTGTATVNITLGSIFYNGYYAMAGDLPQNFIEAPYYYATNVESEWEIWGLQTKPVTTSKWTTRVDLMSVTSQSDKPITINMIAIGKWK